MKSLAKIGNIATLIATLSIPVFGRAQDNVYYEVDHPDNPQGFYMGYGPYHSTPNIILNPKLPSTGEKRIGGYSIYMTLDAGFPLMEGFLGHGSADGSSFITIGGSFGFRPFQPIKGFNLAFLLGGGNEFSELYDKVAHESSGEEYRFKNLFTEYKNTGFFTTGLKLGYKGFSANISADHFKKRKTRMRYSGNLRLSRW